MKFIVVSLGLAMNTVSCDWASMDIGLGDGRVFPQFRNK